MTAKMDTGPKTHDVYTVGWVCALPKEQTAATAMLDRRHAGLPKPKNDPNTYTLGSVGNHSVVIACLPKGQIGNNSAASVATWMISTFPSIKFGLMVGIGGGVPSKVRLGDVVVSTPVGQFPGVVQWDFGKAREGGSFERTGSLNNPPTSLLTALTALETEHDLVGSKIPEYLEELREKWPKLVSRYLPSNLQDVLFKADYGHTTKDALKDLNDTSDADDDEEEEEDESCRLCDKTKTVKRKPRDMAVHFGLIASGNQVIKDATLRNKLNKDLGGHLLCIEMEAAGLVNNFPCIVIRGICDYADSHKNKDWQEYAAVVAAAFAKEFLAFLQPTDIEGERPVKEIVGQGESILGPFTEFCGLMWIDMNLVLEVVSQSGANVQKIRSHLEQKQELEIVNWITPINYGPQQSDFLRRRQHGTGQWLLNSTQFEIWKKTKGQTMFCPGMPGAGKTIISSIVIDYLDQEFQADPEMGIAYVYCNYKRQENQTSNDLLASLLKQLAGQCQPLPTSVRKLYNHHEDRGTRPSAEEISRVLLSVAATFSKLFILVDALDECQESERLHFVSEMFNLQVQHGANIFVTSRFISEIMDRFKDALSLEIRATDEDVRMYLESRMSQLRPCVLKNRQLQEEIKTAISEAVDGMFLLAQIYLGFLDDKLTTNDIRQSLKSFQKQNRGSSENKSEILSRAYDQVMERINQQRPGLKQLAAKVLSWITCAKRPLSIPELQYAVAIKQGQFQLDDGDLPHIEDIVSVCLGLITIDDESSIIRLVHYTTQEYFVQTKQEWVSNAHAEIARSCITFLSFDVFETGYRLTENDLSTRLETTVLYGYAVETWGYHARNSPIENNRLILDFLQDTSKVSVCSQAMVYLKNSYLEYAETKMTGLHLAAYFGLDKLTSRILEQKADVNCQDQYGQTPLSFAAENGHDAVVQLLLEQKADINSKIRDGQTPLSLAATNGHKTLVQLLLEHTADVDCQDQSGQTPFSFAAENGHDAVVQLLLERNSCINTLDIFRRAPLSLAARNGHNSVVKLLLENNINVDSQDDCGRTPLSWAVINNHVTVVKLLLERKADVNCQDQFGRIPLSYAAEKGHDALVQLLLEWNSDINSVDIFGRTPLFFAQRYMHWPNVVEKLVRAKSLLEQNIIVGCEDISGAPLSLAVENGRRAGVSECGEIPLSTALSSENDNSQTPIYRPPRKRSKKH
jgi:ankyrin repeat protein/nucleoside phosphorylase